MGCVVEESEVAGYVEKACNKDGVPCNKWIFLVYYSTSILCRFIPLLICWPFIERSSPDVCRGGSCPWSLRSPTNKMASSYAASSAGSTALRGRVEGEY